MSYSRTTTIDSGPSGDTVKQGILDLDTDLTGIFTNLTTHEAMTTNAHGVGSGTICGTTLTQTLTNKTLSGATITGTITLSGATITGTITLSGASMTGGTATNLTLVTPTIQTPTMTGEVTCSDATLTGGDTVNQTITTPTITGADIAVATISDSTLTGTITCDVATFTGGTFNNPTLAGTVTCGTATITGATVNDAVLTGIIDLGSSTFTPNYKAFVNNGGTDVEWASGIAVGSFTRTLSATGDLAITGVGFKPACVRITASQAYYGASTGLTNGATTNHVSYVAGVTPEYGSVSTYCLLISDGTKVCRAVGKTMDADGFTLTFSTVSSPSNTLTAIIGYEAHR